MVRCEDGTVLLRVRGTDAERSFLLAPARGEQYWFEVSNQYCREDRAVVAARSIGDAAMRGVVYAGVGYDPIDGYHHVAVRRV